MTKCFRCLNEINLKKDHYVLLGTYNRSKSKDEENFFHFQCFTEYFQEQVTKKSAEQTAGLISSPQTLTRLFEIAKIVSNCVNSHQDQENSDEEDQDDEDDECEEESEDPKPKKRKNNGRKRKRASRGKRTKT